MRYFSIITFFSLIFSGSIVTAAENEEITYLLSFVAESNCIFIRNGTEHPAKEASEHLAMKYNRFKRHIKTAEIFIDKIASKSSFSGRPYEVLCNNVKMPTKSWLQNALTAHRLPAEN